MKVSVEREVKQEIMSTDVYVNVISTLHTQREVENDVDLCFEMFREFEKRFSRFQEGNELRVFNAAEGKVIVSEDLFSLLSLGKRYFQETRGLFDIGMLSLLEGEGYQKSKVQGFVGDIVVESSQESIDSLVFGSDGQTVEKSQALRCDLGGIGKGYIADQVVRYLKRKYDNFLVDAGGDIYASGSDRDNQYDHWAIEVASLKEMKNEVYLLVNDRSVATSGIGARMWNLHGEQKHHIIDTRTGRSLENDLESVTVISDSVVYADVWAKTLLILGRDRGMQIADERKISALFVDKEYCSYPAKAINKYIWKA